MGPIASAMLVRGCPDREALIDFDLGRLPAQDLDTVASHLSSCEQCVEILHDLQGRDSGDSLVALLKNCLKDPFVPDDPACTTMEVTAGSLTVNYASSGQAVPATDPAQAPERVISRSFGPYELFGKIGQGGMGVVYRAQQRSLKRMVALKMILAGQHADPRTVARFLREGKAVARLRHPNVVQVYELGESEGLPYYSMELVEGGSLHARLAGGPLGPREAAGLVRTLAAAAEYAHREGVIHRDLKPANILLAGDGTPKITDFGLAKLLDADAGAGSDGPTSVALTQTDTILGTASYMAPEQAEGRSSDVGRATDVYALGAILYATLTGRPPFAAETKLKTLELVRSAPPAPPSRLQPGTPSGLEAICLKCLEKSPLHRYSSAQALADDLGRWLSDERPRATPGLLTRVRRGVRRNRVAVLTGTALLMVGLALFALWAAVYLKSPARAIRRIEGELAQGRAVTLIGSTGEPKWIRWLTGTSNSQWDLAPDHTFRIHSGGQSLVELLTDPQAERYRFTAQVRHETSELAGEIGLFFALTTYPGEPQRIPIHFFTQLTFNDQIKLEAFKMTRLDRPIMAEIDGPQRPVDDNVVRLSTLLYSEEKEKVHVRRVEIAFGPRFQISGTSGGKNPRWHHLEVIVTPEKVTARWNGQPFRDVLRRTDSITVSKIEKQTTNALIKHPPPVDGPLPRDIRPVFKTRGGLGLLISAGSASFREVKLTPL